VQQAAVWQSCCSPMNGSVVFLLTSCVCLSWTASRCTKSACMHASCGFMYLELSTTRTTQEIYRPMDCLAVRRAAIVAACAVCCMAASRTHCPGTSERIWTLVDGTTARLVAASTTALLALCKKLALACQAVIGNVLKLVLARTSRTSCCDYSVSLLVTTSLCTRMCRQPCTAVLRTYVCRPDERREGSRRRHRQAAPAARHLGLRQALDGREQAARARVGVRRPQQPLLAAGAASALQLSV
jgi:hypothetical protein